MINTPQALILAAGIGKRFWPLTTPKPLFSFAGTTLLEANISKLKKAGFKDIIIVASPKLNLVDSKAQTVVQKTPQGMAAAILTAGKLINLQSPILIINATDIVDQGLYKKVYSNLKAGKNILVGRKATAYFPGGYFKLKNGRPLTVVEKPPAGKRPSDLVKLVFDGFQKPRQLIKALKNTTSSQDDSYEKALTKLLSVEKFALISYSGIWQATKLPHHLLDVCQLFLGDLKRNLHKSIQVAESATIKGQVVLASGVKVFANAVIKGPAYIGKNTVVGTGALVRDSIIGQNCVVGYNTEVARSYIADHCWFHSNYIGDSILGSNISLGSGATLANFRLDEKDIVLGRNKLGATIGNNVRLGVNTNIMPGIKIGSNSLIGAGLTISKDIPDQSYLIGSSGSLKRTKNTFSVASLSRDKLKNQL